ncbi:hypothetical protein F7725_012762 [Dissostichus mawsoni]|uniref:Transmembrane protein 150A n=1 Tax=Dissostichus mawsoni TaxID=36200 RepID=A0A7J5YNL7_DISMA|nr:hypothetical protein F7725_012762 [Dissostichus mawsoni]
MQGPVEQNSCAIPPFFLSCPPLCVSLCVSDPTPTRPPPDPSRRVATPARSPPLTPCLEQSPLTASPMTAWIVLPVSLSAFSITGIWIVTPCLTFATSVFLPLSYAMAVMNHHVCPVENWSYNVTCTEELARPGFPKTCCTIQDIPLISKCGSFPPESCLFSLIGNVGAFMVVMVCFLRYAQVDHAKSLHYVGAGVAFPAGLLFVCLQCVLTYRVALTTLDYWMAHFRVALALGAMVSLVLSGIFFVHESFVLQHAAAICEWVFTVDILVFYGTFTYEFGTVTSETMMAGLQHCLHHGSGILMGPRARGSTLGGATKGLKSPGGSSTSTHLNCTARQRA